MRVLMAGLAAVMVGVALAAPSLDELPYPQGKRFPLGLYSIHTVDEMRAESARGWNIGHRYSFIPEFLDTAREGGMTALPHLDDMPEEQAAQTIADLAARGSIAWWDLPEELRHWREDEFGLFKNLCAWTRKYDPEKRPNYMYLPGHYGAEAIAKYVPHMDIIGAGAYTEYVHQPRAWVRYRVESTIEAIKLAGARVGPDYLNGEKTPIGIPMLFCDLREMDVISPVEGYHDFYSCLAAGARGILLFSYWHKRDVAVLEKTYDAYAKAASEVAGPEGLGEALLFGTEVALTCEVTSGPQRTCNFRPYALKEDISYPSVNVLAKVYQGSLFVVAVNSNEHAVKVRISGLPEGLQTLGTPFETRETPLQLGGGAFEDSFGWLGVHLYKGQLE